MSDDKVKVGPLSWTPWPTIPLPTEALLRKWVADPARGPDFIEAYHQARETRINAERTDPLQHGWDTPPMRVVRALLKGEYVPGMIGRSVAPVGWTCTPANDILELGGNGSGKTWSLARLTLETLTQKPGREVRVWSQNEVTSRRYQQPPLFAHLPPHLRPLKKLGQRTKISYTEATGFSESVFTFEISENVNDRPCVCLIQTYKGWEQDKKSAEGGECDLIWWDEEAPSDLIDTLRFRTHKRGGVMVGSFTPVAGYTETVAQYLEGGTILETVPAADVDWQFGAVEWAWGKRLFPEDKPLVPGCPPGEVPLVLQSGPGLGRRFVVLFPTPFNPFTNVQAIIAAAMGKTTEYALERIWGWPTKRAQKAFPRFSTAHIIPPERVPSPSSLTIRCFVDPHGDRNWFMLWIGVDAEGNKYVLREWPGEDVGEWALPGSKPDGKVGPAQRDGAGRGFNDYKRVVYEQEGWLLDPSEGLRPGPNAWRVVERYMDPRPAGTSVLTQDTGDWNYITHLSVPLTDGFTVPIPGVEFLPAPACMIQEGTQIINDWLSEGWNADKPVDPLNHPRFFVSSACANLIYALRTWTGADGEKGATKDPIDCLKWAAKLTLEWYDPAKPVGGHGGSY